MFLYRKFAFALVACFMMWGSSLYANTLDTQEVQTKSKQFIQLLVGKKYAEAAKMMSAQMLAVLDASRLEGMMLSLQLQLGMFQQILDMKTKTFRQYRIVLVTCGFQHHSLIWRLVFDEKGLLAGIQFLPAKTPTDPKKVKPASPQRVPPYADLSLFTEQSITFGKLWKLQGTLSLPKGVGNKPVVILVHGSGPHDQDETIGPNKVFRDIAWGLSSRGIAVFRYGKRTHKYAERLKKDKKLTEMMSNVESEVIEDVGEAVSILAKTPGIDPQRIFVLGHSLGGMLAPAIALYAPQVAGLIVMAGAMRPLDEIVLEQQIYLMSSGEGGLTLQKQKILRGFILQLVNLRVAMETKNTKGALPLNAPLSYWQSLQRNDPKSLAPLVKQPFLVMQGGRDYQVTMEDYELWKKTLQGQSQAQFRLYPSLNHLFLDGKGKSLPAEYLQEGFVYQPAIVDMATWVLQQKTHQSTSQPTSQPTK